MPVYQLLGGACRDRVFGFRTVGSLSAPDCLERAREAVAEGWPAIRFAPADPIVPLALLRNDMQAADPSHGVRRLVVRGRNGRAVHRDPGPVGRNAFRWGSTSITGCRWRRRPPFCQRIPRGSLAFLEEPIRCENPDAYATLRTMTDVPFAIGEEFTSKWAFLPYIERGLTNYARVDVGCVGGLTEARKVAGWCEAHYIDLMPHNPIGPVCTAATVHLAAATNNFTWIECIPQLSESER